MTGTGRRARRTSGGAGDPRRPHGRRLALLLALLLSPAACTPPERALLTECIAPANAGGGWDLTCRLTGQILADLGARRLRLITDHPKRRAGLHGFDLEVVEHVPLHENVVAITAAGESGR